MKETESKCFCLIFFKICLVHEATAFHTYRSLKWSQVRVIYTRAHSTATDKLPRRRQILKSSQKWICRSETSISLPHTSKGNTIPSLLYLCCLGVEGQEHLAVYRTTEYRADCKNASSPLAILWTRWVYLVSYNHHTLPSKKTVRKKLNIFGNTNKGYRCKNMEDVRI